MEKISYQPLIAHLKDQDDYYSGLLAHYELNHGLVPSDKVASWMLDTVEPLMREIGKNNEAQIDTTLRAFIPAFLDLLGRGTLLQHEVLYRELWKLFSKNLELFGQHPAAVLRITHAGLNGVLTYQPKNALSWITLLENSIETCAAINELKALGRVAAWMSGLAHLRENSIASYQMLSEKTKTRLSNGFIGEKSLEEALNQSWKCTLPIEEVGGFSGYPNGVFIKPPLVTLADGVVMATDAKSTCAIFKDCCGTVLLRDIHSTPLSINPANLNTIKEGKLNSKFSDVSSFIKLDETLIFTRYSSYKVYIVPAT